MNTKIEPATDAGFLFIIFCYTPQMQSKNHIVVILGQTATGKSAYAVELAKKINGEVISADSRQVYKGLDLGTGKITKKEMGGIQHHLLDIANSKKQFNVATYQKLAQLAIAEIANSGKVPIVCGGTGLYIDAIIYGDTFPAVPPNKKLRAQLQKKTTGELFKSLQKKDPKRAETIDQHNKVRLVRALEIVECLGKVPTVKKRSIYDVEWIGLKVPEEILKQRIHKRLIDRIKKGMIKEAEVLHEKGLSWKRMRELGLEYKFLADHLTGKLTKEEMIEKLNSAIWQYAKRQMTWFKRNKEIKWINNHIDQ